MDYILCGQGKFEGGERKVNTPLASYTHMICVYIYIHIDIHMYTNNTYVNTYIHTYHNHNTTTSIIIYYHKICYAPGLEKVLALLEILLIILRY